VKNSELSAIEQRNIGCNILVYTTETFMLIGILSDTHNRVNRAEQAVELFQNEGAELLVHCGDLANAEVVAACSILPFYFVFGNHDADMVRVLQDAATKYGAHCLGWGGEFTVDEGSNAEKRVAVTHGHLTADLRPLLQSEPHYLLTGHSHIADDWREGKTRRINPGALFRAAKYTVALLDTIQDELNFLEIAK